MLSKIRSLYLFPEDSGEVLLEKGTVGLDSNKSTPNPLELEANANLKWLYKDILPMPAFFLLSKSPAESHQSFHTPLSAELLAKCCWVSFCLNEPLMKEKKK